MQASERLFCILISLILGCASKKPVWGDPETGFILQYRMSPKQMLQYSSITVENTTMEMMGQSMESQTNIDIVYSMNQLDPDVQKNNRSRITIDSLNWMTNNFQGEQKINTQALFGKSFGITYSPIGKELAFSGIDTLPKIDLGRMGGQRGVKNLFRSLFPDLAEVPIKIGGSWTSREEHKDQQNNMDILVAIDSESILEGEETIDGVECLRIKTESQGTLDGEGSMMGSDMTFEGDLEATSTWFFDYKNGLLIKAVSEDTMEGTVAVSGQANMTIPMSQESKSEIKCIRK